MNLRCLVVMFSLFLVLCGPLSGGASDYRVGSGDVLKVSVYDHADLQSKLRVSGDGSILFPLIGQVPVVGLTVKQVGELLAEKLADGYLVNPQVSVFIEEFRSSKVIIVGQVDSPGMHELSGPTSLLELISRAGGLTRDAGDKVTIHRKAKADQPEKVIEIDLEKLLRRGDARLDIPLADGDSIFVSLAGMVYVTGEVNKPDSYKIEDGETIIMAITKAGGFTNLAAQGRVKIIRKVEGEDMVFEKAPMNMEIQEDDVVVVPESYF